MENASFEIELNRWGVIQWRGNVNARPAALHGIYRLLNGRRVVLLPDDDQLRDALPYRYKKAFDRAIHWWVDKHVYNDCTFTNLHDHTGHPMGTITARVVGGTE